MSILLKAAAGLIAGAIVGVLIFTFWPRLEPAAIAMKPLVEKPKFVSAAAAKTPDPAPSPANATPSAPATAAAVAAPIVDKAAIEKLAMALRGSASQADGTTVATPVSASEPGTTDGHCGFAPRGS